MTFINGELARAVNEVDDLLVSQMGRHHADLGEAYGFLRAHANLSHLDPMQSSNPEIISTFSNYALQVARENGIEAQLTSMPAWRDMQVLGNQDFYKELVRLRYMANAHVHLASFSDTFRMANVPVGDCVEPAKYGAWSRMLAYTNGMIVRGVDGVMEVPKHYAARFLRTLTEFSRFQRLGALVTAVRGNTSAMSPTSRAAFVSESTWNTVLHRFKDAFDVLGIYGKFMQLREHFLRFEALMVDYVSEDFVGGIMSMNMGFYIAASEYYRMGWRTAPNLLVYLNPSGFKYPSGLMEFFAILASTFMAWMLNPMIPRSWKMGILFNAWHYVKKNASLIVIVLTILLKTIFKFDPFGGLPYALFWIVMSFILAEAVNTPTAVMNAERAGLIGVLIALAFVLINQPFFAQNLIANPRGLWMGALGMAVFVPTTKVGEMIGDSENAVHVTRGGARVQYKRMGKAKTSLLLKPGTLRYQVMFGILFAALQASFMPISPSFQAEFALFVATALSWSVAGLWYMVGIEFWPTWKKFVWGFYSFVYFPLFLFVPAASIYFNHPLPFSFNLVLALGGLLPAFFAEIKRLLFPALSWLYRGATGLYTWSGRETSGTHPDRSQGDLLPLNIGRKLLVWASLLALVFFWASELPSDLFQQHFQKMWLPFLSPLLGLTLMIIPNFRRVMILLAGYNLDWSSWTKLKRWTEDPYNGRSNYQIPLESRPFGGWGKALLAWGAAALWMTKTDIVNVFFPYFGNAQADMFRAGVALAMLVLLPNVRNLAHWVAGSHRSGIAQKTLTIGATAGIGALVGPLLTLPLFGLTTSPLHYLAASALLIVYPRVRSLLRGLIPRGGRLGTAAPVAIPGSLAASVVSAGVAVFSAWRAAAMAPQLSHGPTGMVVLFAAAVLLAAQSFAVAWFLYGRQAVAIFWSQYQARRGVTRGPGALIPEFERMIDPALHDMQSYDGPENIEIYRKQIAFELNGNIFVDRARMAYSPQGLQRSILRHEFAHLAGHGEVYAYSQQALHFWEDFYGIRLSDWLLGAPASLQGLMIATPDLGAIPGVTYMTMMAPPSHRPPTLAELMKGIKVSGEVFSPEDESTLALLKTMQNHASDFRGARVLDLACGSGILSVFAASLGAREVVSLDIESKAVSDTAGNAEHWGYSDRILALRRDLTSDGLSDLGQFDIIIGSPPPLYSEQLASVLKSDSSIGVDRDGRIFSAMLQKGVGLGLKPSGKAFFFIATTTSTLDRIFNAGLVFKILEPQVLNFGSYGVVEAEWRNPRQIPQRPDSGMIMDPAPGSMTKVNRGDRVPLRVYDPFPDDQVELWSNHDGRWPSSDGHGVKANPVPGEPGWCEVSVRAEQDFKYTFRRYDGVARKWRFVELGDDGNGAVVVGRSVLPGRIDSTSSPVAMRGAA